MSDSKRPYTTDLAKAFEELGPWVTKFTIKGRNYGGDFDAMNDARIEWFFQYFSPVRTILELGSLEGGHSIALSRREGVDRVVGIESRKSNIEKARFAQKVLNIHNVEFIIGNLESYKLQTLGIFDAVFCSGILYHLPSPWKLIEQISKTTKKSLFGLIMQPNVM